MFCSVLADFLEFFAQLLLKRIKNVALFKVALLKVALFRSCIVFNNFNECNATAHIAVSKPTKLFLELLDHGFKYAFETCGLRRLTGLVEADNSKAIKLDKHIGFVEEGIMEKAGSEGQDMVVLVLWPHNYRRGKKNG